MMYVSVYVCACVYVCIYIKNVCAYSIYTYVIFPRCRPFPAKLTRICKTKQRALTQCNVVCICALVLRERECAARFQRSNRRPSELYSYTSNNRA